MFVLYQINFFFQKPKVTAGEAENKILKYNINRSGWLNCMTRQVLLEGQEIKLEKNSKAKNATYI